MKELFAFLGLGALGLVGIILFILFVFAIGTALTGFVVALIWNWCGLHTLFNTAPFGFWEVIGVAAAINLLRGIFSRGTYVSLEK